MKDAYYFPHDSNAHNDPKCSALRKDFGLEGYGVYWFLIEVLHDQGGYIQKFPKMIDGLAFELRMQNEALLRIIEALVHDYELLRSDEKSIWSERVLRNLEMRREKSKTKAEAGRIGGQKSGLSRASSKNTKQNEAVLEANEAVLEANELKERKVKEKKEDIYSPEFCEFWSVYPRLIDKSRAYKAWKARVKEGAIPSQMVTAATNYRHDCENKRTEEKFIKHPATFLNPDWAQWLFADIPEPEDPDAELNRLYGSGCR